MSGKVVFGLTLLGIFLYLTSSSAQKKQPTPETVHLINSIQGPALYKEYCAVCHGTDGKGDRPMAGSLKVGPT
jgi:cytochrome c